MLKFVPKYISQTIDQATFKAVEDFIHQRIYDLHVLNFFNNIYIVMPEYFINAYQYYLATKSYEVGPHDASLINKVVSFYGAEIKTGFTNEVLVTIKEGPLFNDEYTYVFKLSDYTKKIQE